MKYFLYLCVFMSSIAQANPIWCSSVDKFKSYEINIPSPVGLTRQHMYKIGKLTLVGMAVGASETKSVKALATSYASSDPSEKRYCTWYFNDIDVSAINTFNYQYLPAPFWPWPIRTKEGIAKDFDDRLSKHVEGMVSCAEKYNYLAMGCQSQKHRGPSAFAYFLGVSGCDPDMANDIVNNVWGTNHVPKKTRRAIAEKGFEFGSNNPDLRQKLQKLMTDN